MQFNPATPKIMHIDLNSCFASIEQQANPFLRGKPVVVGAYTSASGCILAASTQAKRLGVNTGMRIWEGKKLCPSLIVLPSDPNKYKEVHIKLHSLLTKYTNNLCPKSIDEFVLNFNNHPILKSKTMFQIAKEIKTKIKKQIGDALTVSIGIGPNRFLAKMASNVEKPDGLIEINKNNFIQYYCLFELRDLHGISWQNEKRLKRAGIHSTLSFYLADIETLKTAFNSISGYYWYLRLRGRKIDNVEWARRSFGNSYALPKPFASCKKLAPILAKLVEKTSTRLRAAGFKTQGVSISTSFRGGGFWRKSKKLTKPLFDSRDIYKEIFNLLKSNPHKKPVKILAESCFYLKPSDKLQLEIFENIEKKQSLVNSQDTINNRWGDFVITSARMLSVKDKMPDRIAFGNASELNQPVHSR